MSRTWRSPSFFLALGLHLLLMLMLLFSFEKTIRLPEHPSEENKPIIDAVMVNNQTLKQELERLNQIEKKKIEQEKARQQQIIEQEREAREKLRKEELLAIELKKKNEALKKEAERQELAREKLKKEQKMEKERLAKEKKQHEEELKKLKQKEEALLLAQKKKIEEEKKASEEKARQQANIKVKLDHIMQHAMIIKNKINQNWRQPLGFDLTHFSCEIDVKLLPTGEVVKVVIRQSSGNVEFDRSAELAVFKASPLPMPSDQELAKEFRQFSFTFRPEVV